MNWIELENLAGYFTKEELISINSYNLVCFMLGNKTLKEEIRVINNIIR